MVSPVSIFISYRRSDTISITGRIYDRLSAEFGEDSVFMDADSIPFGVDFSEYLDEAVSQCQVLLVIIGKTWLSAKHSDGTRRLDNTNDYVRIEIEAALQRDIPVIPVLVEDAKVPSLSQLPSSLQQLVKRNAVEIGYDPRFNSDMIRLTKGIRNLMSVDEFSGRIISSSQQIRTSPHVLGVRIGRRRTIQALCFAGGGIGLVLLGQKQWRANDWKLPELRASSTNGSSMVFNVATINVLDKTINVERKQSEFRSESLGYDIALDLMKIPEGSFVMGSLSGPRYEAERPNHNVTINSFWIGKHPITQAQWRAVSTLPKVKIALEVSPSQFNGYEYPVEQVTWDEAIEFCDRLSQYSGRNYRLPSEAEWEYACRAGTETPFHFGASITTDLANYKGIDSIANGETVPGAYEKGPLGVFREETTKVGTFNIANAFGLYDLHGNVHEWCLDPWHMNYENAPTDGSVWSSGGEDNTRIIRGGAWTGNPYVCTSSNRYYTEPNVRSNDIGFRVVCTS